MIASSLGVLGLGVFLAYQPISGSADGGLTLTPTSITKAPTQNEMAQPAQPEAPADTSPPMAASATPTLAPTPLAPRKSRSTAPSNIDESDDDQFYELDDEDEEMHNDDSDSEYEEHEYEEESDDYEEFDD